MTSQRRARPGRRRAAQPHRLLRQRLDVLRGRTPHRELRVTATSEVRVDRAAADRSPSSTRSPGSTPATRCADDADARGVRARLAAGPRRRPRSRDYAAQTFTPGRPLGTALVELVAPHPRRLRVRVRAPRPSRPRSPSCCTGARASARTSRISRSAACARSGCRPATSAATWRPTRRPASRSCRAPTPRTPGPSVLRRRGLRLGRPRPDQRPVRRRPVRRRRLGPRLHRRATAKGVILTDATKSTHARQRGRHR